MGDIIKKSLGLEYTTSTHYFNMHTIAHLYIVVWWLPYGITCLGWSAQGFFEGVSLTNMQNDWQSFYMFGHVFLLSIFILSQGG